MSVRLVLSVAALILLAAEPLRSEAGRKSEFPGYLMFDASCAEATHVLLSPCPPNTPYAYVVFPDGRNIDRWLGRLVSVRGTGTTDTTCSLPLVQATRIGDDPILPPCPPQECQPGDPPPCPQL
jgi:hypothetical protein